MAGKEFLCHTHLVKPERLDDIEGRRGKGLLPCQHLYNMADVPSQQFYKVRDENSGSKRAIVSRIALPPTQEVIEEGCFVPNDRGEGTCGKVATARSVSWGGGVMHRFRIT